MAALAVTSLKSTQERELVKRYYGIGRDAERLTDIAKDWGCPQRTVERMLSAVLKKLAGRLSKWR